MAEPTMQFLYSIPLAPIDHDHKHHDNNHDDDEHDKHYVDRHEHKVIDDDALIELQDRELRNMPFSWSMRKLLPTEVEPPVSMEERRLMISGSVGGGTTHYSSQRSSVSSDILSLATLDSMTIPLLGSGDLQHQHHHQHIQQHLGHKPQQIHHHQQLQQQPSQHAQQSSSYRSAVGLHQRPTFPRQLSSEQLSTLFKTAEMIETVTVGEAPASIESELTATLDPILRSSPPPSRTLISVPSQGK
jgi:hypothetical protein